MGTDGSVPMALDYFAAMGGSRVFAPERVVFALDHYAGDGPTAALHQRIREFAGVELPLDDRLVLANMAVEMGAKNGIFPALISPDPDARYVRQVALALDCLTPQIALPHRVDHIANIGEVIGTPVHMVYLGT